jgi:hypothetical protein
MKNLYAKVRGDDVSTTPVVKSVYVTYICL